MLLPGLLLWTAHLTTASLLIDFSGSDDLKSLGTCQLEGSYLGDHIGCPGNSSIYIKPGQDDQGKAALHYHRNPTFRRAEVKGKGKYSEGQNYFMGYQFQLANVHEALTIFQWKDGGGKSSSSTYQNVPLSLTFSEKNPTRFSLSYTPPGEKSSYLWSDTGDFVTNKIHSIALSWDTMAGGNNNVHLWLDGKSVFQKSGLHLWTGNVYPKWGIYRGEQGEHDTPGDSNVFDSLVYRVQLSDESMDEILLVPTTECLLSGKDGETNITYTDQVVSDDFLASHVLRIQETPAPGSSNVRDSRGKAKQFNTLNGRTVVVKESFVYSNKGFRNLNQAQLLSDEVYYPDQLEAQQWLIYYISRPLIGSYEQTKIIPASISDVVSKNESGNSSQKESSKGKAASQASHTDKKDIKTFNALLNSFPMIARQLQPGLERVLREVREEMHECPRPQTTRSSVHSRRSSTSSRKSNGTIHSKHSNGHPIMPSSIDTMIAAEDDHMRKAFETAVTTAIDLFQQVDKQQLSFLGSTTDLTGIAVEHLIERYIAEQLHDSILFPAMRDCTKTEDSELESRVRSMQHLDVAQVGIAIEGGREGKNNVMDRVAKGVDEFRILAVAGSPQEMLEILLKTQKALASDVASPTNSKSATKGKMDPEESEKAEPSPTMNADTLVSLLLLVIIRSQVRHLYARIAYIREYIFVDDVESGEKGYALSTFEIVLSYLTSDAGGLRKASRRNKLLWQATKEGNVAAIRDILEPRSDETENISSDDADDATILNKGSSDETSDSLVNSDLQAVNPSDRSIPDDNGYTSEGSTLAHVFPFQATTTPRKGKHVSMDMRSLSSSSEFSFVSRTTTMDSRTTGIEGDTSIETLAQTQDLDRNSVLMMAVEASQPNALDYLLTLEQFLPQKMVVEDANNENTTLLSAAVQLAHVEVIEILLRSILRVRPEIDIIQYFSRPDNRGRTVAHYLFNAPHLLERCWKFLPWRQKDKNGQTPLLAMCRSYDHAEYSEMVSDSIEYAMWHQRDYQPLHLDDHVDAKGNTLLHIVNDPSIASRILRHCDSDANATNDKQFTPLMVASKYGRMDMVLVLFGDKRVDPLMKEARGMTAVELAKDDEIRNRIDDMVLVANVPAADGRVTAVVRSFFVEDASIRLIIKSAVRNDNGTIGVTTCRRSLSDFENLARWLSLEHPASWISSIFNFRSPFQIANRPSKAVLYDIQVRLDKFLKIMLAHSTFSTHELLWEFILFPEIQPDMMAERSRKKAEIRNENVRDEYEPVEDIREISTFVEHARDSIRGIDHLTKSAMRRANSIHVGCLNFSIAIDLCAKAFATLPYLPGAYTNALSRFAQSAQVLPSDPHRFFFQDMQAILATILAILSSLARPHSLINSLATIQKAINRHDSSLRRSDRWPLGLLDETRNRIHAEARDRAEKSREELTTVSCELRYTQQTVASELAGWQELHVKLGKRAIRLLAQRMVVREKDRLESMKRAIRGVVGSKKG
ncbi:hypothetical protein ACLMJK_003890 [Lecanora helva]